MTGQPEVVKLTRRELGFYAMGRRQGQADALLDTVVNLRNAAAEARDGKLVFAETPEAAEAVEAMATVFDSMARQFDAAAAEVAVRNAQWKLVVGEASRWSRLRAWLTGSGRAG